MTEEVKPFPTSVDDPDPFFYKRYLTKSLLLLAYLMDLYGFSYVQKHSPLLVIEVQIFRSFLALKSSSDTQRFFI